MKSRLIYLLLTCTMSTSAQTNLVPNPSFEDTMGCPQVYPDLDTKCLFWRSYRVTPDYFNNCSVSCGYLNQYGFQNPHSGNAYAGIVEYHVNIPNAREHLGVQLISPLVIGTKYFVSFFVSSGYKLPAVNMACNKLGAHLTTYQYSDSTGSFPLPDSCTIWTDSIIADTVGWVKVIGSFIADSAYQHLVIGNWFNDSQLDTLHFPNQFGPFYAYYYLDDVCLSTDSFFAATWTGIVEPSESIKLKVFPNPSKDNVYIESNAPMRLIHVYNALGQMFRRVECGGTLNVQLPLSDFYCGIYLFRIMTNKGIVPIKIIVSK